MANNYVYELWNGKEVVGYYHSMFKLMGDNVVFNAGSVYKAPYKKKQRTITCPLIHRTVSNNGIDLHFRIVIDVRKKSKQQIDILKGEK